MTNGSPDDSVTVVIPTFNRSGFLVEMVHALKAQTHEQLDVVFVDDGSSDETPQVLESAFGADPRFSQRRTTNRGPSAARNAVAMTADTTWVAFTDDDCVPRPGWIAGLVAEAERTGASVVQGKTITDPRVDMGTQPWFTRGREVHGWNGIFQTCNLLVRTSAFQAIGGFDERFPTYGFGEDRDLGARLVDAGAATAFAERGELHHRVMTMTYGEFLKRRYRWSHVVQVLDVNPDARATLRDQGDYLFRYPGVGQVMHVAFWVSLPVAAWAVATGRWWVVPVGVAAHAADHRLLRVRAARV
ncbi:MAG: glycosyltransferase family 2 protein, partial [Acidimicrobiales bacterium]|nr:glycosyltransferase family 2 protein [Acidimicrobiales bacterium]